MVVGNRVPKIGTIVGKPINLTFLVHRLRQKSRSSPFGRPSGRYSMIDSYIFSIGINTTLNPLNSWCPMEIKLDVVLARENKLNRTTQLFSCQRSRDSFIGIQTPTEKSTCILVVNDDVGWVHTNCLSDQRANTSSPLAPHKYVVLPILLHRDTVHRFHASMAKNTRGIFCLMGYRCTTQTCLYIPIQNPGETRIRIID